MRTTPPITICCALCLAPVLADAADWPRFRGPSVDGRSAESAWRARWSDADAPRTAWTAQVGIGFAAVSVANGRLYTVGHSGKEDLVWCLDAATGKEIWKKSYPAELVDNLHEGGPAATPTVSDGTVYTLSKDGQVFAWDATSGEKRWRTSLVEILGVKMPEWGFSSSILEWQGRLILDAGPLIALDRATGKLLWKTKDYKAGYASPVLASGSTGPTAGEEPLVTTLNNAGLIVVRPKDGSLVDLHPWESPYDTNATTPIVSGKRIFVSTGYEVGATLLELDEGKLRSVYETKAMRNHMNACVLIGDHVYGFDGNSNRPRRTLYLVCIELATGEVAWKEAGLGCGSLTAADGKLILQGDRGELAIAAANPERYEELGRVKPLDGKCWTSPVLANGRIYCRNAAGTVACVDVSE